MVIITLLHDSSHEVNDPTVMSNKNHNQGPTTPSTHTSKIPKFFQKANRDRSKSVTETCGTANTVSNSASDISKSPPSKPRKSNKFSLIRDKEDKHYRSADLPPPPSFRESELSNVDEPPVIVEPVAVPRSRHRSERASSAATEPSQILYSSTSSSSRISDLPTRLSGWFSHTFSNSATDLSLPSLLSQSMSTSPNRSHSSALMSVAKHGKGHLDRAMRYLLDSDSSTDKCTEPIWLLGVQHPGYEPPPTPPTGMAVSVSRSTSGSRRSSSSFRSSNSSFSTSEFAPLSPSKQSNPAAHWPPVFYADFTSRIWLTYRSQFTPIRDIRLADLSGDACDIPLSCSSPATAKTRPWHWGREKIWSTDSGWGCMLRTGQSLLANALIHTHLGRDWRRPPHAIRTADYATYVQILTWFFDTPSPEAPFSVHRMALAGKEFGTDVGQWFGPSTAAGAIKTLISNFPEAGLGVSVATDGMLFQTDVFTASHLEGEIIRSTRRHKKVLSASWGERPVLLLIGLRLGLDGVNPVYYDTIKLLYTFPQSVGIAGGRPSSSYYFVGSQADNLFYLDPHHARPAIPLRPAPPRPRTCEEREATPESLNSSNRRSPPIQRNQTQCQRAPASPSSVRTGSSNFSYHAPHSPSPLHQQLSQSSSGASSGSYDDSSSQPQTQASGRAFSGSPPSISHRARWSSSSQGRSQSESPAPDIAVDRETAGLDPVQEHYVTAYFASELRTFHCERVRKMPLSGLDPSMLLGFLCKDEADWWDFRKRVADLPRMIFSVQDEPPSWPSDSDEYMGLESISEPDDLNMDLEEDERLDPDEDDDFDDTGELEEEYFDTQSIESTPSSYASGMSAENVKRRQRRESKDDDLELEPEELFPFPVAEDNSTPEPGDRSRSSSATNKGGGSKPKRMHNVRARDGGRTQSGGVKGVVTEG